MHQRDRSEKYSLIPVSQIFLEFPAFLSLLFIMVWDDRREIVGFVLPSLPVGNVGFYIVCLTVSKTIGSFHGKWIDGDTQHHISVHVANLFDHGIINVCGK